MRSLTGHGFTVHVGNVVICRLTIGKVGEYDSACKVKASVKLDVGVSVLRRRLNAGSLWSLTVDGRNLASHSRALVAALSLVQDTGGMQVISRNDFRTL